MALPKWDTMTDESQAMVKKVGLIGGGGLLLLAFSKMLLPLALLGGGSYVAWRALNKKQGAWKTAPIRPDEVFSSGPSAPRSSLGAATSI